MKKKNYKVIQTNLTIHYNTSKFIKKKVNFLLPYEPDFLFFYNSFKLCVLKWGLLFAHHKFLKRTLLFFKLLQLFYFILKIYNFIPKKSLKVWILFKSSQFIFIYFYLWYIIKYTVNKKKKNYLQILKKYLFFKNLKMKYFSFFLRKYIWRSLCFSIIKIWIVMRHRYKNTYLFLRYCNHSIIWEHKTLFLSTSYLHWTCIIEFLIQKQFKKTKKISTLFFYKQLFNNINIKGFSFKKFLIFLEKCGLKWKYSYSENQFILIFNLIHNINVISLKKIFYKWKYFNFISFNENLKLLKYTNHLYFIFILSAIVEKGLIYKQINFFIYKYLFKTFFITNRNTLFSLIFNFNYLEKQQLMFLKQFYLFFFQFYKHTLSTLNWKKQFFYSSWFKNIGFFDHIEKYMTIQFLFNTNNFWQSKCNNIYYQREFLGRVYYPHARLNRYTIMKRAIHYFHALSIHIQKSKQKQQLYWRGLKKIYKSKFFRKLSKFYFNFSKKLRLKTKNSLKKPILKYLKAKTINQFLFNHGFLNNKEITIYHNKKATIKLLFLKNKLSKIWFWRWYSYMSYEPFHWLKKRITYETFIEYLYKSKKRRKRQWHKKYFFRNKRTYLYYLFTLYLKCELNSFFNKIYKNKIHMRYLIFSMVTSLFYWKKNRYLSSINLYLSHCNRRVVALELLKFLLEVEDELFSIKKLQKTYYLLYHFAYNNMTCLLKKNTLVYYLF